MNDINNPLEQLKVEQALRCENMKFEYRTKNKPEEINILDYTVIKALEKQMPKKFNMCEDSGDYICPCCFGKIILGQIFCDKCGQKLDWSNNNE